jgi:DNA-binding MarR family transcriptional regulator
LLNTSEFGGKNMNDDIHLLLNTSEKLNSQTVSLTRCIIMALLSYFVDGIQYRELKTALRMSDGKLIANLNVLRTLGYIVKSEADVDERKLDVYSLTAKGKSELNKISEWMKLVQTVASEGDKKCQVILTK